MVDFISLLQTILYGVTFILGLLVSIPVGVTQAKFEGHCILYSKTNDWAQEGSGPCTFSIAFSVIALVLYSLPCAAYHGLSFWRSRNDKQIGLSIWNIPFLGINAVITLLVLVMACILSVGYAYFCNDFAEPHSCENVQNNDNFKWYYNGEQIDPGTFHDRMTLATAASWIAFIVFLCQVGFGVLRMRNKRSQNQSKALEASQAPARATPVI